MISTKFIHILLTVLLLGGCLLQPEPKSIDRHLNLAIDSTSDRGMNKVTLSWSAPWAEHCIASDGWLGVKSVTGSQQVHEPFGDEYDLAPYSQESAIVKRGSNRYRYQGEMLFRLICFKDDQKVEETVTASVLRFLGCDECKGSPPPPKEKMLSVELLFGTNRLVSKDEHQNISSGIISDASFSKGDWSDSLYYGVAQVNIPKLHRPGFLERPVWWKLEFNELPDRHVILNELSVVEEAIFFERLEEAAEATDAGEVFIFVHGFNVSFDEALMRTAQLSYDLRLNAVPITFSWPSNGAGASTYFSAENNSLKSVNQFAAFVTAIRARPEVTSVNVLAHSMGNRIVVDAMAKIASEFNDAVLKHVLLAAPDIDKDVFEMEVRPALAAAKSTTMYSSDNDKALVASKKVHGGVDRAGSVPLVIEGMDTVDSSDVDTDFIGHSYYVDVLIQDIYYILHHGLPATERNLLKKRDPKFGAYWALPN